MASLNKVFLIGNLTRDPELKYIPSGSAVGKLGLAVNRKFKTAGGEFKDDVCYVNVTVWGKQAESCNEFLSKGSPVFVEGRLQFRSWESSDGQKKSILEVVAERVQFLGGKKTAASSEENTVPEEIQEPQAQTETNEEKPPF
ncbi:MAG: single-stranded DNA-binding protein [Candidatus Firestonebacteria bacterium]